MGPDAESQISARLIPVEPMVSALKNSMTQPANFSSEVHDCEFGIFGKLWQY
jgi:hypothetical protein